MTPAGASAATTYTVTTTSDTATNDADCTPDACSLRQAVNAATTNGDRIVVPAGTFSLGLSGELLVSSAITIQGAGAGSTVIQGTPVSADRVMLVSGNSSAVTLVGLTITGGDTTSSLSDTGGGGIAATGPGPLVLEGVDVDGNTVNTAAAGAGDDEGGGGILTGAALILDHSSVSDNTVTVPASRGDSGGGGILSTGDDLTSTDSSVSDNTATVTPIAGDFTDNNGGGGLYQDGGDLTVQRSVVDGNTAAVDTAPTNVDTPADGGGGIYQFGDNFLLADSAVAGNVAHGPGEAKSGGGGILDDGDSSQYVNSTVTGNSTDQAAATTGGFPDGDGGGGVLLNRIGGGVTMANMTITDNSAGPGAGGGVANIVYANQGNSTSTVNFSDSILAGNTAAAGAGDNCAGPMTSDGYNVSDDAAGDDTCAPVGVGDILTTDPRLGALGDNGGPTPTQALLAGGPAIDAGNPAGCTDLLGRALSTDQRGVARPLPSGGRCDSGAYELGLPVVLTGTAANNGTAVTLSATAGNPDPRVGSLVFQYGATVAYGSSSGSQPLAGDSVSQGFSASVSGLAPGTYHFRALATSPAGTSVGGDAVFTVSAAGVPVAPVAPAVTTGIASQTGPFSATITGAVGPEGQATTYEFEFGSTTHYGSSTTAHGLASGPGTVPVAARLTRLRPGRTYHYRLVAINATGTTKGGDRRFRTSRRPSPRGLSSRIAARTDPDRPFVYLVSGRLSTPPGVSRASGCRGVVTVTAVAGRVVLARARATVGRRCRYHARLHLTVGARTAAGRARVSVHFTGNHSLAGRTAAPLTVTFGHRARR